jgi:hypothetical protein
MAVRRHLKRLINFVDKQNDSKTSN